MKKSMTKIKKYQKGGSSKDSMSSKTGVEGGGIYKTIGDTASSMKSKGMSKATKTNRPFKMGGPVKKKK